jgi:alanine racemase
VAPADLHAIAAAVEADPLLQLESIWTHLPVADGNTAEDRAYTEGQLDLFDRLVADLAAVGITAPVLHAANTAGAVAFTRARHDMVRCGLGLYGYLPSPMVRAALAQQSGDEGLRPAMALKARVVAVRTLEAGERPSYGRLRPLPSRSVVATVPIGYADGVPRALFGAGYEVLIGGVRRPLAGMVTMDQIVVDCGPVGTDPVELGDEVVLLGRQGGQAVTATEWAERLGTIPYEVLCDIGPRVPRLVTGGGGPPSV